MAHTIMFRQHAPHTDRCALRASTLPTTALALACLMAASVAQAGRPLTVDDASVNPAAQCQLETWLEQSPSPGAQLSLALSPACGLGYGVEVGTELVTPHRPSRSERRRALAVNWVHPEAEWLGWQFGGKLAVSSTKAAGTSDSSTSTTVLGIATYPMDEQWTLHLNLGAAMTQDPDDTSATGGIALVWTPTKHWLVFGELSGTQGTAATRGAGVRYWLMPEELGMDLTVSKVNATQNSTAYTLGVSWYGIKF